MAKPAATVLVSVLAAIPFIGRRGRLRKEIRENLAVVRELEQDPILRDHTPAAAWLQGRIAVDVARLSGHRLGTPKRPLPVGSMIFSGILGLLLAGWTWYIDRDGFVWYSVFPGVVSALFFFSVWGMTLNRELPPDEHLPEGATPLRSDDKDEQIASQIALAAAGEPDERYDEDGQVGVVFRFVAAMREGRYEDGLKLAHEDWLLSRVQAWLWNTRPQDRDDKNALLQSAESLADRHEPDSVWKEFIESERAQFREAWVDLAPDSWGAASRRRRISADCDLVIIAPVGDTGGYYVASATILPNAMTFVVRKTDSGWKIANHIGAAPATPGMAPAWWISDDPALEALDETNAFGDQDPSVERQAMITGLNGEVARSEAGAQIT